jgi:hypothetical protein
VSVYPKKVDKISKTPYATFIKNVPSMVSPSIKYFDEVLGWRYRIYNIKKGTAGTFVKVIFDFKR